ncbi:calcium-binding protein [Zavarzinia aquatilis]|uniref:Calcium-binding protein n=1 Tax=Zavarzinia aquatilis TaxID=2211142 RepID=A0A317EB65_9PROT|nr:calcium-binding protein [Zavarzinia aquatilis]PWR24347.1 hypothetical protein DKG74_09570 [Zavarzinia aquatilis]
MATFTSSVQVDLTHFENVTTGGAYIPFLGSGVASFYNSLTNVSFNAVGPTVFSLIGSATGIATDIHVYDGAPMFVAGMPAGTTISLTGIAADMTDVTSFLTSTTSMASLMFLAGVLTGDDMITGSSFDDVLIGGLGADTINGGIGVDTVSYFNSMTGVFVSLSTGLGARGEAQGDVLTGIESIEGSSFADKLVGDAGINVLTGGDGDDQLIGGAGADQLIGGLGNDTASYSTATSGVFVDLFLGSGSSGDALGDAYISIENVTGSAYMDSLSGDGGDNRLQGLDGDDTLMGQGGNDTILGDAGADTLIGGDGDDVLQGRADDDFLYGNDGADRLIGGTGADTMSGGVGNDIYEVDDVGDSVSEASGEGTDRVISFLSDYTLTDNVEVLVLGAGAGNGTGNSAANTIKGNGGDNVLSGGDGVDTLQGFDGADTLIGGAGNDRLYGGAGNDTFVFNGPAGGVDRIADWNDGDAIVIDTLAFGIDVSGGLSVANGTSPAGLVSDCVFYNTSTGRVYAYDADVDTLTAFAVISAKPAALDITDVFVMV